MRTRTLLALLVVPVVHAACAPNGPPSPPPPSGQVNPAGGSPKVVSCPQTDGPKGTDRKTVNRQGVIPPLVVKGPKGMHQLDIPRWAAPEGTVFEMTALAPPLAGVEAHAVGHDKFEFQGGMKATLRLSAHHCRGDFDQVQRPFVLRLEKDGTLTPFQPGGSRLWVVAELDSLSRYAIGAN